MKSNNLHISDSNVSSQASVKIEWDMKYVINFISSPFCLDNLDEDSRGGEYSIHTAEQMFNVNIIFHEGQN